MKLIEFITSCIDNLMNNYLDIKNNIQEYYYNKEVIKFYEGGGGENGL